MIRPWPEVSRKLLIDTPVFRLRRDRVCSPRTSAEHDVFVLETSDWINVVALTPAEDVVFVRQWRHGTRTETLEIPGGLMDPADASPEAAARRELLEETGYAADAFFYLGVVDPNPAIQTTACHTFLATGARVVAEQNLDHGEDIEVETVAMRDVPSLIDRGVIRHALVVAAFAHFDRYLHRRP
jgi:8-oxo-dGTP pyrophosphatase MutT (NUDIX family)